MFVNKLSYAIKLLFFLCCGGMSSISYANTQLPLPLQSSPVEIKKKILDIQHWVTSNGVKVYFVATPKLPIVDILIGFAAGSSRDGTTPGLANLTNVMLSEGTADLDADKLASQFENLGVIFNSGVDKDIATVSIRSLTTPHLLDPALKTLSDLLKAPVFSTKSLKRKSQQVIYSLNQQQQSLDDIADNAFFKALYQTAPYAHSTLGTQESIAHITRKQLQAFYKKYYTDKNAIIIMVGALDKTKAENIANQLSQSLINGAAAPNLTSPTQATQPTVIHINYNSTQTHIQLGQLGITHHDPDYFPLIVGNYVLGGNGLISILSDEIREKRGLTYGVYSYFIPLATPGPFIISLETPVKTAQQSLILLQEVLNRFISQGPTDKQLDLAKKNLLGGFALRLDSNKAILANLMIIAFYQLPLDYLDTYKKKINDVTAQQIRDAFQRRIHPDKMVTVTVGEMK